jgi:hypothetical protein
MTRADIIKYPPAIDAFNATRFHLDRVRVSGAYTCLDATGNTGGFTIGEFECSGLSPYRYAAYTASASGTTLTVSAVTSGAIVVGQRGYAFDAGNSSSIGYRIVSQISGPAGGAGDYQIDASTTFSSRSNFQMEGSIKFDGALDYSYVTGGIRCWPYDLLSKQYLFALYVDQTTNCAAIGRVDGLRVAGAFSPFKTNVVFTPNAGRTSIPYQVAALQEDLEGADFIVEPATNTHIVITEAYSTKGAAQLGSAFDIRGGNVTFSHLDMPVDDSAVCAIKASGTAVVQINSGRLVHTDPASSAACARDDSALKLFNLRASIPLVNRTAAFFDSTASANGSMQLVNITGRFNGSALTGNAYSFANDSRFNRVQGVSFPGWAHNLPFATSLGYYDLDEDDQVTVAPTFATMGDFSAANLSYSASKFKRSGNFVDLRVQTTFDTNAYTTAAGNFTLVLTQAGGGNIPTAADSNDPCMIGGLGKVTSGAGMWTATLLSSSINLWANNSTVAPAQLTATNLPASTTGISMNVRCRYRVR